MVTIKEITKRVKFEWKQIPATKMQRIQVLE